MSRTVNIALKNSLSCVILTLVFSFMLSAYYAPAEETVAITAPADKLTVFRPVFEKLRMRGMDTNFVKMLIESENTSFNEKFVLINVTGQLGKTDYSHNWSDKAVDKSKQFLDENRLLLELAELRYNVPKEVITSVLWVETKHGSYLGKNNIVSVFLSTALADQPEYIEKNIDAFKESFTGDSEELKAGIRKIQARAAKKSNWAINELIAMEQLQKLSPTPVTEIRGSWAGAFGMSQFLPSSYVSWAIDGDGDGKKDLFDLEDAIFSVANYLKTNGWEDTPESWKKAVYHYNNSNAYVEAVLKLAQLIKS